MGYKLEIAQKASEHLDQLLAYLLNPLKSDQAAKHLLSGIEEIYDRLEEDPWQFPAMYRLCASKKGIPEGKNTGHGIAYDLSGK